MAKTRPVGSFRASFELSGLGPGQPVDQEYVGGGSRRKIVRTGAALRGGGGGSGRLRAWRLFPASTVEGIEGLGHDGRSARVARGSDVSRAVAGPALYVGHWLGPGGSVENLTIPFSGPFHKGQLSGIPTGGGPQSSVSFGVDLS